MTHGKPLLFLIICTLFAACGGQEAPTVEPSIRPVKFITISDTDQSSGHFYTGLSKARKESALSFKVSGTINERLVKVGDRVRSGQLLATLDPTDYRISFDQSLASVKSAEAQIQTAEAQLESAKANFLSAESNYKRSQNLYETNSISLNDFEQAKSGYEAAKANFDAANTQVEAAKAGANSSKSLSKSAANQISYTRLTAPFAGVISSIEIEQNEAVMQGSPVMIISSEGNPKVEVGVPENVISQVRENATVQVRFSTIPDKTYKGKITEVGYSPSGSTYPVTIDLENGDERIRPGMPTDVEFDFANKKGGGENIMRIPTSAVGGNKDGNFVYVLESAREGVYLAKRTPVTVGEISEAGFEIKSGLSSGQYVAAAGLNNLRDGMEVRLFQDN